jgi:hypothetical protein
MDRGNKPLTNQPVDLPATHDSYNILLASKISISNAVKLSGFLCLHTHIDPLSLTPLIAGFPSPIPSLRPHHVCLCSRFLFFVSLFSYPVPLAAQAVSRRSARLVGELSPAVDRLRQRGRSGKEAWKNDGRHDRRR